MHAPNNDTIHQGCLETCIAAPERAESEADKNLTEREKDVAVGSTVLQNPLSGTLQGVKKLHESIKRKKLEESVCASVSMKD